MSSDCDIAKGLCCQVQRRHRQAPRKVKSPSMSPPKSIIFIPRREGSHLFLSKENTEGFHPSNNPPPWFPNRNEESWDSFPILRPESKSVDHFCFFLGLQLLQGSSNLRGASGHGSNSWICRAHNRRETDWRDSSWIWSLALRMRKWIKLQGSRHSHCSRNCHFQTDES